MRQPVVGLVDVFPVNERINELDSLDVESGSQQAGIKVRQTLLVEVVAARNIQTCSAKIIEIVIIAYLVEVDVGGKIAPRSALMFEPDEPSILSLG